MGLYATVTAEVECPRCGGVSVADWQFRLGAVHDMPCYVVGDVIRWDGVRRQTFGEPQWPEVIAVGWMAGREWCVTCRHPHALADIHVLKNRIERVTFRSFEPWIAEILFVGPERTPV